MIAVIDDDAPVCKSIATLLKACGYRVELYESAKQFLATEITEQPARLILDVYANGMKVPTVFVSASRDQRSRQQAMDLGCVAFIEKPFEAAVLIDAVTDAIGSARPFEKQRLPVRS